MRRLLPLALCLLLAACPTDKEPDPETADPDGDGAGEARSTLDRDTSPPDTDGDAVADGNTAFALDLYRALAAAETDDLFLSPFSVSVVLAMAWGGARGETETAMATGLHLPLSQERLHPAMNWLILALDQCNERAVDVEQEVRLDLHEDVWGQEGTPWNPAYLDLLAVNYGAPIHLVDFAADPDAAVRAINDVVDEETGGRIPDLLAEGTVSKDTRLVLTNAVFFKAAWNTQFGDHRADGTFTRLDDTEVTASFMQLEASLPWADDGSVEAVVLPYDGEAVSMLVLLPAPGTFEAFEASLDADRLDTLLASLEPRTVQVGLPPWHTESSFSLKGALSALGMEVAFQGWVADFSGMADTGTLYLSDAVHRSVIDVDENGTEAAAASAVVVDDTGSIPEDPVRFWADRPFLYLIRDEWTGTVLFVGRDVTGG